MMNLIAALAVLFIMSSCATPKNQACPKETIAIYLITPYGPIYTELKEGAIDEFFKEQEEEQEDKIDEMAAN